MKGIPEQAFILAAGKGTRMKPLTDAVPKPMVQAGGKPVIDHALDRLEAAGVGRVVVNLYHLGEVLEAHLRRRRNPEIIFSREDDLLDTGGGVKKALHYMQDAPFFLINGDALWENAEGEDTLAGLASAFEPQIMDMILLLQNVREMQFGEVSGDYDLLQGGMACRNRRKQGAFMFAGVRIVHPRVFADTPQGAFSFLDLMDRSEERGRLYGQAHRGRWYHISTPEDLAEADRLLGGGKAAL